MLTAIDGSDASFRILDHVRALAAIGDTEVIVYHVNPLAYSGAGVLGVGPVPVVTADDAAQTLTKAGIKARAIAEDAYYGHIAKAIVEAAARESAKAIVIGSRGPGKIAAAVLGSVAYQVLHLASQPVFVIPTD